MSLLEELSRQSDQAEVFSVESESVQIGFEANKLKSARVEETQGVAVRAIVDGRLGFAASSDVTARDRLLENVLASARRADPAHFGLPRPSTGPQVRAYDARVANLRIPDLVSMGQELVAIACGVDPRVHVKLDLERSVRRSSVRNSLGTHVEDSRSPLSIS